MRLTIYALSLVCICCQAQNQRFYRPGQPTGDPATTGLLLKWEKTGVRNMHQVPAFANAKAVKVLGFNTEGSNLDSTLRFVASVMQPTLLVFQDCDLDRLNLAFDHFKNLQHLQVLGQSSFFESTLFYQLRSTDLRALDLNIEGEDIILDSLHLLRQLETIRVSNTGSFKKTNSTVTFLTGATGARRSVSIAYCGSLEKESAPVSEGTAATTNPPILQRKVLDCISEPVKGIAINDAQFAMDAKEGGVFEYESGTTIEIGANSFVDETGKPYRGPATIFYREFRDPVDILLSGIPMTTTVNGEQTLFRSGGMYEIGAYDEQGKPLQAVSDTVARIRFALADTSSDFRFYTLNNDGSWTTEKDTVIVQQPAVAARGGSRAVQAYFSFLRRPCADTTNFSSRFYDHEYLYKYRRDNLQANADSTVFRFAYGAPKRKGYFKIKYTGRTKEDRLIFTIVPANKDYRMERPRQLAALYNRHYIYIGELSRDEFKKTYCRKKQFWDVHPTTLGETLELDIKSSSGFLQLPCQLAVRDLQGKYISQPRGSRILNQRLKRSIAGEARLFNRKARFRYSNYNDLSASSSEQNRLQAYSYAKQFMDSSEQKMDLKTWMEYASTRSGVVAMEKNQLSTALVRSGMGIRNIDTYIHRGQMEPVLVRYDQSVGPVGSDYCAMLYSSINTSQVLSYDAHTGGLSGYYFRNRPNYVLRFSDGGFLQVTKPEQVKQARRHGVIELASGEKQDVRGLSSLQIKRLIFQ